MLQELLIQGFKCEVEAIQYDGLIEEGLKKGLWRFDTR